MTFVAILVDSTLDFDITTHCFAADDLKDAAKRANELWPPGNSISKVVGLLLKDDYTTVKNVIGKVIIKDVMTGELVDIIKYRGKS